MVKPILTEKSTKALKNNVYVFEVNMAARSFQIKTVIEILYQVKVGEIRVMVRKGKNRRVSKKLIAKKLPNKKIAYISLTEGKIDLFPKT